MAKVLLVEDDNNLREIFEMRLQADGYQTLTANNGEEALEVAMREKPDLIVADVMMPKLSGFEMLETLRAAPGGSDIKVIMMTALGQAEDQARGEKLGVIKYLVKSQVTLEDFARVVNEILKPGPAVSDNTSEQPAVPSATNSSSNINKEESEKFMPEDTTPTNPSMPGMPPVGDGTASPNPISGPTAPSDMGGMQQSTSQEQSSVQGQINDFAASTPAPSADTSVPADPAPAVPATDGSGSSIPVTEPPAYPGNDAPSAPATPPAASNGL